MERKKIYISSKMSEIKDYNYPAFDKKAAELEEMGFEVLNPADIGREHGTDKTTEFYRRKNLEMLLKADILFIFGDVMGSKGVRFELFIAKEIGLPIWIDGDGRTINL